MSQTSNHDDRFLDECGRETQAYEPTAEDWQDYENYLDGLGLCYPLSHEERCYAEEPCFTCPIWCFCLRES
jgi:hypothetical protein